MTADLDLNGNQILNLPAPVSDTDVVRLQDLHDYIDPIPYVEDLVDAAEASATAAALAETNAETAETGAEAAQTGAELAQTEAENARDTTLAYRDETAAYAGATNTSGIYVDTTAGLAGTADGGYFYVPGTDGMQLYREVTGVANAGPLMPSATYVNKRHTVIYCDVAGYNGGSANRPILRPIDPSVVLTGDCTGSSTANPFYLFVFTPEQNSIVGSYSPEIEQYGGANFLPEIALTDSDGAAPGVNGIQAGRVETIYRRPGAFTLERWRTPDTITAPLINTVTAITSTGKIPSPDRPVMVVKAGDNLNYISIRLHEDNYADASYASQSDHLRVALFDQGDFQADTNGEPVVNSFWSYIGGQLVHTANFLFKALDSGTTVETGLVPSTMEPVMILGDFADAANTTNFVLSGPGHGHVTPDAWTLIVTRNDSSTSNVDVDSADLSDAAINTEYGGIKAVVTTSGEALTPAAVRAGNYDRVVTFEPTADYQVKIETTFDFTTADGITPGTRTGGYAVMAPLRDMNEARSRVNGVWGSWTRIDLRDGSVQSFGQAEKMEFRNKKHPNTVFRVTNLKAVDGSDNATGFTHYDNGVGVAFETDVIVINNPYGPKCYYPIYTTTGKLSLASKVLTFAAGYGIFDVTT